jgi:D-sedoheptulose 7-phosphate isomerase
VSTAPFIEQYLQGFQEVLARVPAAAVERVVGVLEHAYQTRAKVFIAGNGGSAALASHLACDLEKTAAGPHPRLARQRLRAHALTDNLATLTAWANDEGYEVVFAEQLRAHAETGDVLVVISASGNSPNIVAALETALELGLTTVALVGFDGGRALELADQALHVKSRDYGVVEGAHGVLTHAITACLVRSLADRRSEDQTVPLLASYAAGAKAGAER